MRVKIYLREWFYNAGIIGFLKILEHSQKRYVCIEENYIEFDTKDLVDFHHCYFNYFFDRYNLAEKNAEKIKLSFSKIKNNLEKEPEQITEKKEIEDKIKAEKKYIKAVLKTLLDKVKKIDQETYENMLEYYNQIDSIKEKEQIEQLEEIQSNLIEEMKKEKINKTVTMNSFKSILSKNYFGQPSFLNVLKTSLSFEEQQEVMYKDYISNIVEIQFIQEIIDGKYTIEELTKELEKKEKDLKITKEMIQIYTNIRKKYINKNKDIEEIQRYLKEKFSESCSMCENEHTVVGNYSESNFVPLAISSDNMKNFFWNQNANFPICDICKLILFCIPAGITSISKTVKEIAQGKFVYKEKELLSFINYDISVQELLKTNNNFSGNAKKEKSINNPYTDLLLDIVKQNKEISEWQLENIFVVEFEAEYGAYSRIQYFNIKRYMARFFIQYASILNAIQDYSYRVQIVDYILKNKDIKYVINERIKEEMSKNISNGFYSYLATKIRVTLNLLKKEEDINMEEQIKKNNAKISVLYNLGIEIHDELKKKGEANKLDSYIYKMLNFIRLGNKKELMDTILRIHISMGKGISPIFLDIMKDDTLDYEAVGQSFIAGLISNKKENKEEVQNNG